MFLVLPPDSTLPLHEQVAAAIRGAVRDGRAEPGERLPSARDLARDLDMNMHTVLRAYQTLRDEGVLELRRGRGAVITHTPIATTDLAEAATQLVSAALRHGLPLSELHDLLDRTHSRLTSGETP